ncbi:hypothetical protein BVRB_4g096530 [Beta vulgaris subsp. vulgaris]|uniref:Uncharacterized protein n=1 Tax=Beta vulgaris subsp. vulgaris TaxID=3555 RepID=A0A0J8BDL0_BETVV|nr:hypothetical protein BVRB_4g096530 [Beta vulgaris subsp. vulgaris]
MITEPPLSSYCEPWSFTEDKLFEECIAEGYFDIEDESTRWLQITTKLGGKRTPAEIQNHYYELAYDVESIENDRVPLPNYSDLYNSDDDSEDDDSKPRKRGSQWSKDEHRLFLIGVKIYKKGQWTNISKNVVVTRSPTQVASHAQKYYSRNDPANIQKRKRSSIHDITVNDDAALQKLHKKGLLPTHILDKLRSAEIKIKQEHSNEQVNNNNNSISPNYQLQTPQVVLNGQVSNTSQSQYQQRPPLPPPLLMPRQPSPPPLLTLSRSPPPPPQLWPQQSCYWL